MVGLGRHFQKAKHRHRTLAEIVPELPIDGLVNYGLYIFSQPLLSLKGAVKDSAVNPNLRLPQVLIHSSLDQY